MNGNAIFIHQTSGIFEDMSATPGKRKGRFRDDDFFIPPAPERGFSTVRRSDVDALQGSESHTAIQFCNEVLKATIVLRQSIALSS